MLGGRSLEVGIFELRIWFSVKSQPILWWIDPRPPRMKRPLLGLGWERKGVGEDAAVVKTEDCTAARDVDESYVAFVVNDIAGRGQVLKEAWPWASAREIDKMEPSI